MKIETKLGKIAEIESEALAIGLIEGQGLTKEVGNLDKKLNGAISQLIKKGDFTGKLNQTAVLYPGDFETRRIILVGLGKREKFNLDKIRQAAGTVYKKAKELKIKNYTSLLYGKGQKGVKLQECAQAVTEGTFFPLIILTSIKPRGKRSCLKLKV
ncbi:MAG: hypothetical protein OEV55_06465 [candidate division Zixibacteria bacterium]|nr:hypothetical protein [candidate division Zixibacteria bacterium]